MSLLLKYSPATQDNNEFHRIREWHNTFNAFVQGALVSGEYRMRRRAKRFADKTHGNIDVTVRSWHY